MSTCDTCRIRKIRCDKKSPCSSCKSAKFECSISPRQSRNMRKIDPTLRQKSVPITHPSEGYRLRTADHSSSASRPPVLKPKTTSSISNHQGYDTHGRANVRSSNRPSIVTSVPSDSRELTEASLVDSEGFEYEGESSLQAHSIAAQDLLEKTLSDGSHVRDNPKMIAALKSLRHIVDANRVEPSQKNSKLKRLGGSRRSIYEVKLPPTEVVLDVIRKSKERTVFTFSPPLGFVARDHFNELCKSVFFRTEDYPTSTAVIVHRTLGNLFGEFAWAEEDLVLQQEYNEWAHMCRTNLEISISNLDILLPATMENAQALLIAASYCMEIAQASSCKKLVMHGCMVVQSLGWHRSSSMQKDSDSLRDQKLVIFWMLYVIDKNLSLRLGQASFMQDYDIDLRLPPIDLSGTIGPLGRLSMWAETAKVTSLVYQQLYSPGALKQTDALRLHSVQQLLKQVEDIRPKTCGKDDISQFISNPVSTPATYLYAIKEVVLKSDEIIYYTLLCMIYRATPTSADTICDPIVECVKTILKTPFVPFTTLFSHVLRTHDRTDLERLQQFAESMSDSPTSQPAYKISRLAAVFVSVATVYVDSCEQEVHNQFVKSPNFQRPTTSTIQTDSLQPTYQMGEWAPINPLLHALGFAEDCSTNVETVSTENANLENWFNGNQQIMALLEDDLSYLDTVDSGYSCN